MLQEGAARNMRGVAARLHTELRSEVVRVEARKGDLFRSSLLRGDLNVTM